MTPDTRRNSSQDDEGSYARRCIAFVFLRLFLEWGLLSLVLYYFGKIEGFPLTSWGGQIVWGADIPSSIRLFISLILMLGVAGAACGRFLILEKSYPDEAAALRRRLLIVSVLVWVVVYLYTRLFGAGIVIATFNTFNLLVFAILLGTWIVAPLRRPAELVPVCIVMALSDLYSVARGPTSEIVKSIAGYYEGGMEGAPPIGDFLLVKLQVPWVDVPMPLFGVADWIIVAFFMAFTLRFGIKERAIGFGIWRITTDTVFYAPLPVLLLVGLVLMAQLLDVALPALPFLAGGYLINVMICRPEARKLTRSDWALSLGAVAIFLGVWFSGFFGA